MADEDEDEDPPRAPAASDQSGTFVGILAWGAIAAVVYFSGAWDWCIARYRRQKCESAVSDVLRRTAPELGFTVERCDLGRKGTEKDVCIVRGLENGQWKTAAMRMDCRVAVKSAEEEDSASAGGGLGGWPGFEAFRN